MYQSYKSRIFRNCSQYYYLSKTGKRNSLDHTAQLWLNYSSDKVLGTIHPDSCIKQLSYQAIYNPLNRQYMDYNEMNITYNFDTNTYDTLSLVYERGEKFFELCNHLGNVMVSISDRKLPKDTVGDNTVDHFRADVLSAGDYYAFGMQMPNRTYSVSEYRFGFNGQEKDNQIYGSGNSYTAEFWQYDARLGRRWNVDPKPNVSISQYATFSCNPIWYIDPLGDTIKYSKKNGFLWNLKARMHMTIGSVFSKEYMKNVKALKNDDNVHLIKNGKYTGRGTITRTAAKDDWVNSEPKQNDFENFDDFFEASKEWINNKPDETNIGSNGNESDTRIYLDLSGQFRKKLKTEWKKYGYNMNLKVATGHDLVHVIDLGLGSFDRTKLIHITKNGIELEYYRAELNAMDSERKITGDLNKWRINKMIPREDYFFNR